MSVRGNTSFWRNAQGNLTITTSIVGLMLATAVGAALDGSRLFTTHQSLQSITDAAALAAAMPEKASNAKREGIAEGTIQKHSDQLRKFERVSETVEVIGTGEQVRVTLSAEVPLLFAGVLGAESRRVSATSLAEETTSSSMPATSLSVVLDLSSSMADRFDSGSKSAAIRAALTTALKNMEASMGGPDMAKLNLSSGLYSFNWGGMDNETVELEPGVTNSLDALVNMALGEGSVPSSAIEAALEDQIDEKKKMGNRERFLIYVADGGVDNEKADERGRYLPQNAILSPESSPQCPAALDETEKAREMLAQHYNNLVRTRGLNLPLVTPDTDDLIARVSAIQGTVQGSQRLNNWMNKYNAAADDVSASCVFVQTKRVLDTCETARVEEDISVIAVNMTPEDTATTEVTKACVFGKETRKKENKKGKAKQATQAEMTKTKRLPNGLVVQMSDDERSIYAEVKTLDDLKHVLATMTPQGTSNRSVRLVN